MKTLNQRLTNKAKVQFTAAYKLYPHSVSQIRKVLKEVNYVHQLDFITGCELCAFVLDSPASSSIVFDAFIPMSTDDMTNPFE